MTTQQEDPILRMVIEWISGQKVQDLKPLLGDDASTEEGKTILQEQKKLTLYQGALYHCDIPPGKLEEVLWFVVPRAHQVATMNGCHWDAGHQCQQQTLCLLHDRLWWPGMAHQMQKTISNCEQCIQHEGTCAKAPVPPIIVSASLELLHVDLPVLRQWWSWINPHVWWVFWSFATTLWNMLWHTWPLTKLQKLLLSFCGKDISWSSEHQPSSWVNEEPTLKATSLENFVSLWLYGRFGLHLTMLKPMDSWNELTKHWCTW